MASLPSLDLTLGAIVVSTFFSFLTMGVILTTSWQYYTNFPKDRIIFKLLVGVVFTLSLVDTVADGYWCYLWTVTNYAQPQIMAILPISLIVEIFCVGTTSLVVQTFFAWRVWKISQERNWMLSGFIVAMSVLQWGIVLWVVVYWSQHRSLAAVGGVLPIGYIWLVSSVVADLTITIAMVYYLGIRLRGQAARSKTSFNQIISRTVQANVLSLLSQVVTFALFKADIGLYFFLNDFTVVKIYAFSLIVSLNTRKSPTAIFDTTESSQTSRPGGISLSNLSSNARGGTRPPPTVSISVRQNVDVDGDSWEANQSYATHKVDPEVGLSAKNAKSNGGY
ncbi:hypothetical protein FPV67DRAFT_1767556 [Lyophyllum atratum]|nr:hypothetical protein FPV67DRAFT_1767556 [Lyophyllum atratum]